MEAAAGQLVLALTELLADGMDKRYKLADLGFERILLGDGIAVFLPFLAA